MKCFPGYLYAFLARLEDIKLQDLRIVLKRYDESKFNLNVLCSQYD